MRLREYQQQAHEQVCAQLDGESKATLIVLPTGTGKTVVASHVVNSFLPKGRVIWLAHREELLSQASTALEAITGVSPSLEMADSWASEGGMWTNEIIVSTVQTQNAGSKRMLRFDPMQFSLLVFDEAHHCTADSYIACLDHYRQNPNLRILGMTATPDRADEEALGRVFDSVAYEYGIVDAINDGWLVPIEQHFVHVDSLDFSQIKTTAGDLNGGELAELVEWEANLHAIATSSFELMKGRKSLVFAVTVAQADKLKEIYNRHEDDCAFIVTGKTPKDERRDLLDRFRKNQLRIMVNVGVATEGFDMPDVEVVVCARPTKSRSLYAQMIGRGTRPLSGLVDPLPDAESRRNAIRASRKPSVAVLDFVGNSGRHKLIHAADILGSAFTDDIIERANKILADPDDEEQDVNAALRKAENEARREAELECERREAEKRKHVKAKAAFSTSKVDPFDVFELTPHRESGWYAGQAPTDEQRTKLEKFGITVDAKMTRTAAGQILQECWSRIRNRKCTYKQAKLLKRFGYPGDVGFQEASKLIDGVVKNGWKRPS